MSYRPRRAHTWRAVLIGGLLAALLLPVAGSPATASGGPTIRGTVTNAATGKPVRGVLVVLFDATATRWLRTTHTNADGRYRFASVSRRNYVVRAGLNGIGVAEPGREYLLPTYYGNTPHANAAKKIAATRNATYVRNIAAKPAASVRVVTLTEEGDPVGRLVDLIADNRDGAIRLTNVWGDRTFTGFAPGPLTAVGYETDARTTVRLVAGKVVTATLRDPDTVTSATVKGRVLNLQGNDHPELQDVETGNRWNVSPEPDPQGSFTWSVRPGTYRVVVTHRNLAGAVFTVTAGETVTVPTMTARYQETVITGKVKHANGAVCVKCRVKVLESTDFDQGAVYTDRRGIFSKRVYGTGRYTVTAKGSRYPGAGGHRMVRTSTVDVPVGATRVAENLTLPAGYALAGTVTFKGRPVRDVMVVAWGTTVVDTTGRDGVFALRYLPAGTHGIRIRELVTGGYLDRYVTVKVTSSRRITLDLAKLPARTAPPIRGYDDPAVPPQPDLV